MKLRLSVERERRGWSKTRLGFECKIANSIIGKLEAGKLYPYPAYKNRLSEVFGIDGDELFKEVEENDK